MVNRIPSYEHTLSIEELRAEVRMCWDRELALAHAIHDIPEMPSPFVLLFLSRGSHWPEDSDLGKMLQRKLGIGKVPPKSECETGAGVWYRLRQGLLLPRPETLP